MKEVWKDIKGYEGLYQVSMNGLIKNAKTGRIKKQHVSKRGYWSVNLWKENKGKLIGVHRLMASAWVPERKGAEHVNHIDGDKLNNSLGNLEWCTHRENMEHAFATGLVNNTGGKNGMAKLSEHQVKRIKLLKEIVPSLSQEKIGELFGISRRGVGRILDGSRWSHIS